MDFTTPRYTLKPVIIVAVIAFALVLFGKFYNNDVGPYSQVRNSSNTALAGNKSPIRNSASSRLSGGASYEEVLKEYGSRRMQFDHRCQAAPNTFRFQNSTVVMFDNRGAATTITIDGKRHSFGAQEYKLITLFSKNLPHNVIVHCGSQNNVGSILLQ